MEYQTIGVRKLTPRIGAEISGVDLAADLSNRQFDEIHRAWLEHQVLVFRDQDITLGQHEAFGRRFGKLHVNPGAYFQHQDHPAVIMVKADETSSHANGEQWHSDVSCDPEPPSASILHIKEIPGDGGGDTLFASMYAAYDALSEPIKVFLEGKKAVHDGEHVFRKRHGTTAAEKTYPRAEHPIVRTHPETGRKGLFVNRVFTTGIVGLNPNESDAILQMLYTHLESPLFQVRVHWQANSIAMWDNRCTSHCALWDYFPRRRFGYRVTVQGDRPV